MTNLPFALAATPDRARVMRLALQPFSIGHKVMLDRLQSPFLSIASQPSYQDLIRAVLVCSRTHAENCQPPGFLFNFKLWLWLRSVRDLDWAEETEKFRQYISLGSLCPRIKPEGGRSPGAPWPLRLFQFLTQTLHIPRDLAWDYPFGLAQYEWCAHWETEGGLKLWNDDDETFERYCIEQDALEAAEIAARAVKAKEGGAQ